MYEAKTMIPCTCQHQTQKKYSSAKNGCAAAQGYSNLLFIFKLFRNLHQTPRKVCWLEKQQKMKWDLNPCTDRTKRLVSATSQLRLVWGVLPSSSVSQWPHGLKDQSLTGCTNACAWRHLCDRSCCLATISAANFCLCVYVMEDWLCCKTGATPFWESMPLATWSSLFCLQNFPCKYEHSF